MNPCEYVTTMCNATNPPAPHTRTLIVNADDLGLSRSINLGILECFKNGIVNSASLMVTMPGFEDALSHIREHPTLSVGLHVDLLRGEPLCGTPHPWHHWGRGRWRSSLRAKTAALFIDSTLRKTGWIERETRAQIERALRHGVTIRHLDSERNVHVFPPIFRLFARLAREYQIPRLRAINEDFFYSRGTTPCVQTGSFRRVMSTLLTRAAHLNRRYAARHGVGVNDHYFGFRESGALSLDRLSSILKELPPGITELGCHPGFIDDEWSRPPLCDHPFYLTGSRPHEVALLTSPLLRELVSDV